MRSVNNQAGPRKRVQLPLELPRQALQDQGRRRLLKGRGQVSLYRTSLPRRTLSLNKFSQGVVWDRFHQPLRRLQWPCSVLFPRQLDLRYASKTVWCRVTNDDGDDLFWPLMISMLLNVLLVIAVLKCVFSKEPEVRIIYSESTRRDAE